MTSSVTYIFVFGIQTAYKFLIAIHPLDWETLTADTPLPHRPRAQGILSSDWAHLKLNLLDYNSFF